MSVLALLKLWQWLRPLLPYLLAAAAVLAGLIAIERHGEARGRAAEVAKYQPRLERALRLETAAVATIGRLRSAIDMQNSATLALAQAERGKLAEAQAALAVARSHDAARADTIARLKASAARPLPGPVCEASQATKETWK